jgi:hypothetical protein
MAKLRELDDLVKDAYRLHEASRNLTGFAVLSLRVAVGAFCRTYHAVRGRLHVLNEVDEVGPRDDLHGTRYHEAFAECVIHFQHFAELVIKDFLRTETRQQRKWASAQERTSAHHTSRFASIRKAADLTALAGPAIQIVVMIQHRAHSHQWIDGPLKLQLIPAIVDELQRITGRGPYAVGWVDRVSAKRRRRAWH